jgi:uncharacterized membrane protein YiaA
MKYLLPRKIAKIILISLLSMLGIFTMTLCYVGAGMWGVGFFVTLLTIPAIIIWLTISIEEGPK